MARPRKKKEVVKKEEMIEEIEQTESPVEEIKEDEIEERGLKVTILEDGNIKLSILGSLSKLEFAGLKEYIKTGIEESYDTTNNIRLSKIDTILQAQNSTLQALNVIIKHLGKSQQ